MKFNSGVYEIVNTFNGERYIGSSVNLSKRRSRHYADLEGGYHGNAHLQRAFDKYGRENFEFRTLLLCDPENCIMYEQTCIDALKPEYNICSTAGSPLGVKRSDEARAKMSEAGMGRVASEETKFKMSAAAKGRPAWNKGLPTPEEIRAKISEANSGEKHPFYGKHRSEETRKKLSEALKGKHLSDETRKKMSDSQKLRWTEQKASSEVIYA